jgi:hypothetical protein
MNSVFSAFKSNKGNSSPNLTSASDSKKNGGVTGSSSKKTLNLNETNNYEKLRHIREKMSNIMIDDDEINLRKPPCSIPLAPITLDECDSMLPPVKPKNNNKSNGFDCIDSTTLSTSPVLEIVNGDSRNYISNGGTTLSTIKKHYNQDNSENYASENNLLSKCCNGGGAAAMGSDVSIADVSCDVNSSVNSLISVKSMPLSNSNETSKSALTIYNKQPQSSSFSNSARNRPRLSISSANCNSSTTAAANQPAVHGRNSNNGLPTGQTRTRLSTHQRNLSLDFR